jgi:epoxyqueuosine reductase
VVDNSEKRGLLGFTPKGWEGAVLKAAEIGFVAFGVAPAGPVPEIARDRFSKWLEAGFHSGMGYMARHRPQRFDVAHPQILDRAEAVVSVALPYGDGTTSDGFWAHVAAFARARDYHSTLKQRLGILAARLTEIFPGMTYRLFVDSAPIMERTWAVAAGVGSLLKNGAVAVRGVGPRVLLGEIVCKNVPRPTRCPPPLPFELCGECRLCLDSCPTGALESPGVVNGNRCLSYWSIERGHRPVPPDIASRTTGLFGCDICTAVCPLNPRGPICSLEPLKDAIPAPPSLPELVDLEEEEIGRIIAGTPLQRAGVKNLVENAKMVLSALGAHGQVS